MSVADDGVSPEWRLAVSLALQSANLRREDGAPFDTVRRHWVPAKNQETAAVMQGRRGMNDAIALVERRLIEAAQKAGVVCRWWLQERRAHRFLTWLHCSRAKSILIAH